MRDRDNRYTEEVMLSFLIVGHAHEDIDQLFSVLSRYLKKVGKVMGPSEFQSELQNAMHASLRTAHFELLEAVIDWDAYLRPHLVDPAPVGIQHADLGQHTGGGRPLMAQTRRMCTFHIRHMWPYISSRLWCVGDWVRA